MNFCRFTLAAVFVTTLMPFTLKAQDENAGGVQLNPAQVVQRPDAKTLMEKASYLIGFNFMNGAKQQVDNANLDQILQGMKDAKEGADRDSYVLGYQMMKQMQDQKVDLDMANLSQGMKTAANNEELGMTQEEVQMLMQSFSKMMQEKQIAEMKAESQANLAAGEAYIEQQLAANPNLKKLENGCYYEVLKQGTGAKPTVSDRVLVDYTGTFIDGTVFDSSVNPPSGNPPEPADFTVGGVVEGFSSALQNMQVGGKWRVIIPGPLGYGAEGRGKIGPNQMLIFELELLKILEKE